MEKVFEKAIREKFRFGTVRGPLTVEDLWDIPLLQSDNFSLDEIARHISRELKSTKQESFVKPLTIETTNLELHLEIVKHVIRVKLEEIEESENAKVKQEKKGKILELLQKKQDEKLSEKSIEELQAELEDL